MIHLNKSDGQHEWVTEEEFKKRFPDIDLSVPKGSQVFKNRRIKKGIKMRDMAEHLGITVTELSRMEKDDLNFKPPLLDKYVHFLNRGGKV